MTYLDTAMRLGMAVPTWNGDELNQFSPFNLNHNHRNIMGTNHRNVIMKNKISSTYIYTDSTPNQVKSTPNQVKFFLGRKKTPRMVEASGTVIVT